MSDADHERALRAGQNFMAKLAAEKDGTSPTPQKKPRPVLLPVLGVRVVGGDVYKAGFAGKRLGSLAGAEATLTDGTRPHRVGGALVAGAVVGPLGLLVGLSRKTKASAFVVFADGTVHETKLSGKSAVGNAQRAVVRFNALAKAAS